MLVVALAAGSCGTSRSNVEIPEAAPTSSADGEAPPDPATAGGAAAPDPSAGSEGDTDPDAAPPPAVRAAEITQTDCPPELASAHLACALASVPIDPDDPTGPATEISLAVLQGTAPDPPPPLAVLKGGRVRPAPTSASSTTAGPTPRSS